MEEENECPEAGCTENDFYVNVEREG